MSATTLAATDTHRTVCDQMARRIVLPARPQRIVSLVPSQTELLFDLGVGDRVVGVTRYCVHPDNAREMAANIGGTKRFDLKKIAALRPDLVIGNKEENYAEGIQALAADFPVWMSDIATFEHATDMIRSVGELVGAAEAADSLARDIDRTWSGLAQADGLSAAYLIWKKPWMAAGRDTFIHEVLARLGLNNLFAHQSRYPTFDLAELRNLSPRLLLLSSEPFPFDASHVATLSAQLPDTKVLLVDGEMFSWYGSRLKIAPQYMTRLLAQINGMTK